MPIYFTAALLMPDEAARLWIGATATAGVTLLIFAVVWGEKIRGWIGRCASSLLSEHDRNADAHDAALKAIREGMAQLETAVAILNGCVQSQQGQITQVDNARKETLQLVTEQIRQAVDLLKNRG